MEENKPYVELNPNQELHFKRIYKTNPDETIIIEGNNIYEFVKKLQQENAELKQELAILQKENEDIAEARMEICNQCGNRDDYNIPCKMIRDLDYGLTVTIEERDNYEQALEEIKQICDWHNEYNSIDIDDYKKIIKDVESKVNEVLNKGAEE